MKAPIPQNEARRLETLRGYDILDTLPEKAFDDFTQLASAICKTPIALISLVDEKRQWFKSRVGLGAEETHRDLAFCAHAILDPEQVFEVPDATADERFADNVLVTSDPDIRFYAGAPLVAPNGDAIGTLCVIDRSPKTLTPQEREALSALSRAVVTQLELRRHVMEIQNAQRSLQESETKYRQLVEVANDIIYRTDNRGRFVYVNPVGLRMTGYSEEAAIGMFFGDIIAPEHRKDVGSFYLKQMADITMNTYREVPLLRKDGSILWVGQNVQLLMQEDRVIGLQAFARDITDRRRIEAERDRFFTLSLDLLCVTDFDGILSNVNPAWEQVLGYSPEEVTSRSLLDFVHTEDRDSTFARFMEVRGGSILSSFATRFVCKDGQARWIEWTAVPVPDQQLIYAGGRDISARKEAEENLKRAKEAAESLATAKSDFLSTMSHEIRTPMNGVLGMTELLAQTELTEEQREYVETVAQSGESLLRIINDILDFSKFESGSFELEHRAFDLRSLIENVFDILKVKAVEKNLDLLYLIDPRLGSFILGDETRVRQVLTNLVGNALKFTDEGEVFVGIKLLTKEENRLILEFEIRDTGIGIPEDKKERLFKPFSQADSSTTRKYGGTGLGLAISRKLVEAMGGSIRLQDGTAKGSSFVFTISAEESPTSPAVPRLYVKGNVAVLANKRALLVDDNPTNLQILTIQCEQWGMVTKATKSTQEALTWVRRGDRFDVAIFDMQMPGMNGVELARESRMVQSQKELPIILLSSANEQQALAGSEKDLFAAYLEKPTKQAKLMETVRSVIIPSAGKAATRGPSSPTAASPKGRSSLRILIAEDNKINQKLLLGILKNIGYGATVAENGQKVLEILERETFDIIFMDVHMPELDGIEATREIVRRVDASKRPKIIALTADAFEEDREKCLEAGMDDYLRKPVKIGQVRQKLEEWGATGEGETGGADSGSGRRGKKDHIRQLMEETDPEVAVEIIEEYVETVPNLAGDIQKAYAAGDIKKVEFAAHTLKGLALAVGDPLVSELCQTIEDHAQKGTTGTIGQILEELRENVGRSADEYRSILKDIGR